MTPEEFDHKWGVRGYHTAHVMAQVLRMSPTKKVIANVIEFLEDLGDLRYTLRDE
jgi:hypothetical protein